MGGFLSINGIPVAWYACELTLHEADILGLTIGESSAQQAVEALAVLIALRAWAGSWASAGATLRVRSDSISALVLTLRFKTSGKATGIIAREVAIDLARACYMPVVAEHLPGIANGVCDALSRFFQPSAKAVVPVFLQGVARLELLPRGRECYSTLAPPSASQGVKRGTELG